MADEPVKLLGKLEAKRDPRNLMAARYLAPVPYPSRYDWQKHRSPMPARTYGNDRYGDCTLASQANAQARFERIEQRRTVLIPDNVVINNYLEMTGGEDLGWYELDALKRWRTTGFSLSTTRKYTIDAFVQIDPITRDSIKAALWQFKVIKIALQLPKAYQRVDPPGYGVTPATEGVWGIGWGPDYEEGSWGGHSMTADAYDATGLWVVHSWYRGVLPARQLVTWDAVEKYADEAYSVVDSFDYWRQVKAVFDVKQLRADVAEVTAS